jgi:hypothetical protein
MVCARGWASRQGAASSARRRTGPLNTYSEAAQAAGRKLWCLAPTEEPFEHPANHIVSVIRGYSRVDVCDAARIRYDHAKNTIGTAGLTYARAGGHLVMHMLRGPHGGRPVVLIRCFSSVTKCLCAISRARCVATTAPPAAMPFISELRQDREQLEVV